MDIIVNGAAKEENPNAPPRLKLRDYITAVDTGLIDQTHRKTHFLDFLKATPSKSWFLKFRAKNPNPNQNQSQIIAVSENPSPSAAANNVRRRFRVPFVRKINWEYLFSYCKNWVKHPMNISLLIWSFFVAVCLVILLLLMTGLLNTTIRKSSVRKNWTEIVNQILNALFTIMCLYQHPRICHHLVLLCRYHLKDAVELRNIYCKNGGRKRHERAHMAFVIFLLQITCFSQYGLCALYWAYTSKTRPDWPQILFIAVGTGAPVIAGLYVFFSPLGKKTEPENDVEFQQNHEASCEDNGFDKKVLVSSPEWVGGIFDCWDDVTVYCLSFFCTFCVFGWNMERLGFGNMYVHIATFMLLCIAPVLVFSIAALNINNDAIRYVVGIAGIVLCFFGFLYGGFWRIQIRKRFKLSGNGFCFGFLNLGDFLQWLFCWSCLLAQEVRTGNFYDVESDGFYRTVSEEEEEEEEGKEGALNALSRENATRFEDSGERRHFETGEGVQGIMRPPVQNLMEEEDEEEGKAK